MDLFVCFILFLLVESNVIAQSSNGGKTTNNQAIELVEPKFTYKVPATESDWSTYNSTLIHGEPIGHVSTQESESIRLEVRKTYGGSIQIYDKVTKQYLINFFDKGRESGCSTYSGPDSFSDDAPYWRTGYNPLQAGDSGGNSAKLLFHGTVDGYIYTKYQCNSWAHVDNRLLAFFYEQWVKVDGNKVHVKVRLTHQRGDKTFYRAYQQEWPMMMINGVRNVRFYNGDQPFTMAGSTVTDGIERIPSRDNYVTHQLTPFQITEPWMGTDIGNNANGEARLIALTGSEFYKVSYNVSDILSGENYEGGRTITYWAHHPLVHIDSDNKWDIEYTYVIGSEREIRQYVYAQPHLTLPDFRFSKSKGRNGWHIIDGGIDQKEPFTDDNWKITYTGKAEPNNPVSARGTKLSTPIGSWRASTFDSIYIQMKYAGPETKLRLAWLLNGQAQDGVDSNYPNQNAIRAPNGVRGFNQTLTFDVKNDGQMHTYKLKLSNNSQWKGVIQQFEIAHLVENSIIPPGERIELAYFGVRNPTFEAPPIDNPVVTPCYPNCVPLTSKVIKYIMSDRRIR